MNQFVGIEGGGTKFVCVYGSGPDDLHDRTVIRTRGPKETMAEVYEYIRQCQKKADIKAIGVAIFGPLDLNEHSETYGYILPTAKVEWSNYNLIGELKREFNLPVGFDTDVNGAAIGEYRWGAAKGLSDFIYLTVGTGIGGGAMVNGKLLHGAQHPEMGHIMIFQDMRRDSFEGVCAYHKNCLEGLASGPSMKVRWNVNSALDLPQDHIAWDIEAHYLGIALATYTMTLCPMRIILGGGVMKQQQLFPKIRSEMLKTLNGYILNDTVAKHTDSYVVSPGLGENSGILGSIALAEMSYLQQQG
ncbi:MAG TPA: ROK family protein [Gammaproteobacteria bacterium]|nr:ROK family protein [Gammaproteobacteria bacterium]